MKNLDVQDWYELNYVAEDRLDPDRISGWFLASSFFSGLVLIVAIFGIFKGNYINKDIWTPVVILFSLLFLGHIFIIKYFGKLKNMYGKQKLQSVCLSIIGTKLSVEGYLVFFMSAEDNMLPESLINIGILVLVGGLVLAIISTIRGIYRVKQGHLRKGGNGLYDFKNSKLYIGFYGIYFIVAIVSIITRTLSNSGLFNYSLILFLIVLAILQYSLSLALPEFYLLTYCKFKYKEFDVEVPERFKKRYESELKTK